MISMDPPGFDEGRYEDGDDLLTELPLTIIHYVLSFLPLKYILVTSILSKRWYNIFISFDTLVFDFIYDASVRNNSHHDQPINTPPAYLNLIDDIVCRRLQQVQDSGSNLRTFNMAINFPDAFLLSPRLSFWLGKAVEMNVSELFLKILDHNECYEPNLYYVLPEFLLVATRLTSLELTFCVVECTSSTKLVCLRKLVLTESHIEDDYIFCSLSTCCPMIEHINLNACSGIEIFSPNSCVPHLLHLELLACHGLTSIQVEAPKLQTLIFQGPDPINCTPCHISLEGTSTSLKELKLSYIKLRPTCFKKFLSEHPCIEHMMLKCCNISPNLKLLNKNLKRLVLRRCEELQTICIETPNLESVDLDVIEVDNSSSLFSLMKLTTLRKVHIELQFVSLNAKWWLKLQEVLKNTCFFKDLKFALKSKNRSRRSLDWKDPEEYFSDLQDVIIHDGIREVSFRGQRYLKKSLKDSNPFVYISSLSYSDLLDDIFDRCYPKTLSLLCSDNTAKVVHEDIMSYHRNWSRRSWQSFFRVERMWQCRYGDFEVDTCEGVEDEICAPFRKFLKGHSIPGYNKTILKLKWF